MRTSVITMLHIIINHLLYQKGSASVCKSINTKPRMIKVSISIYLKRSTSVLKSVNTKPRMK